MASLWRCPGGPHSPRDSQPHTPPPLCFPAAKAVSALSMCAQCRGVCMVQRCTHTHTHTHTPMQHPPLPLCCVHTLLLGGRRAPGWSFGSLLQHFLPHHFDPHDLLPGHGGCTHTERVGGGRGAAGPQGPTVGAGWGGLSWGAAHHMQLAALGTPNTHVHAHRCAHTDTHTAHRDTLGPPLTTNQCSSAARCTHTHKLTHTRVCAHPAWQQDGAHRASEECSRGAAHTHTHTHTVHTHGAHTHTRCTHTHVHTPCTLALSRPPCTPTHTLCTPGCAHTQMHTHTHICTPIPPFPPPELLPLGPGPPRVGAALLGPPRSVLFVVVVAVPFGGVVAVPFGGAVPLGVVVAVPFGGAVPLRVVAAEPPGPPIPTASGRSAVPGGAGGAATAAKRSSRARGGGGMAGRDGTGRDGTSAAQLSAQPRPSALSPFAAPPLRPRPRLRPSSPPTPLRSAGPGPARGSERRGGLGGARLKRGTDAGMRGSGGQ